MNVNKKKDYYNLIEMIIVSYISIDLIAYSVHGPVFR